ncbi:MAG: YqgE/AlgH family protein [Proteobacteria bacterium]|nr:YqgE/AlgH family protein [Pseudomonadota bacterium]
MPSPSGKSGSGYLTGQLLIAMPQMNDPRFERTVIYICAHTADGAMGLVVNREIEALTFPDLLNQLSIDAEVVDDKIQVLFGGPVETGRGFVLHSSDYVQNTTMLVDKRVGLTATMEVLKDIASGNGPKLNILALGYAGWGPGQLDAEIHANGWLSVPADDGLLFDQDLDNKWERALAKIGVDFSMLSGEAGHA